MSVERLAEIRARLSEPPPVTLVGSPDRERSPVATYMRQLRNDQSDLLDEVDRLKAELRGDRGAGAKPFDWESATDSA